MGRGVYVATTARLTAALTISGFLFFSFFGCRRVRPTAADAGPPLDVAFAGCAAVTASACEIDPAKPDLRLVVAANGDVTVTSGGADLAPKRDGAGLVVTIPNGAVDVTVRAKDRAPFVLALAPARTFDWLDRAKAARAKGNAAEARALAEAHLHDGDARPRALATGLVARLTLAEGRADAAFPLFRDAIALARSNGLVSDAVDDSFALAFALHQRSHRYDEARATLDATADLLPRYPEGRARAPYYRGILASETGDRRAALALLDEAEGRANALGMTRLERNAKAALAVEMQALGRPRASMAILKALARDATGCERREIEINLGWGALLANESAGTVVEDARGPLESTTPCADAYLESFARTNLARVVLDAGDAERAARELTAAERAVKEPRGTDRMAWREIEGRILLAQKQPKAALVKFDEARSLARASFLLEPEWSALTFRALALEALGSDGDAIAALREAEAIVDRAMLLVPLGAGRGSFVADRSRSARAAIDLYAKRKAFAEAAAVAKRSRARVLASVERSLRIERLDAPGRARWESAVREYRTARDAVDREAAADWTLAADALATVTTARRAREETMRRALESALALIERPDAEPSARVDRESRDLEIVIHPGRSGFYALVTDAAGTIGYPLPAPNDTAAVGRALFDPIAKRIEASRRVRVHAYGAYRSVDVHALPFGDRPLVAKVAVDYPLGLRPAPTRKDARSAVVVGDPRADLPNARTEAETVARALAARGIATTTLYGAQATSQAMRAAMRGVDLLHYAGHGVFAGVEGFESALPLADKGVLTVGDVLALAASGVPRRVVLAGCEAARADGDAEGLGLAQAFLVAGAEEAIAPTRPVDDALALDVARGLFDGAPADETLAAALQRATVPLSRGGRDVAAFRVLAR